MAITPDTKNWTWVLDRPCPECGFDTAATDFHDVPGLLRSSADDWRSILAAPGPARRPDEGTWSPLEYAAHVRDLRRVYRMRLNLVLEHDDAGFEDWEQDATAVAERYADQDPAAAATELAAEAELTAAAFAAVEPAQPARRGLRSDGSAFTVEPAISSTTHSIPSGTSGPGDNRLGRRTHVAAPIHGRSRGDRQRVLPPAPGPGLT